MASSAYQTKIIAFHQNQETIVVRAPGRINLIGEHTDYNGGLAIPAAIDRCLYISVSKRDDQLLRLFSERFEYAEIEISSRSPEKGIWHKYVRGVVAILIERGYGLAGFNLHVDGNIPVGAGLSSSAALCCGTVMALDALFGFGLDRGEMALIAQRAEHDFAGVECGLMDQYACLFGKRGYGMKLDFLSMQWEYIRLNLEAFDLILLDTGVKHSLASTAYNQRKKETSEALTMVKTHFPGVQTLRDVSLEMLYGSVLIQNPVAFKRARFFLEENKRVLTAAAAIAHRKLDIFGDALFDSHAGLSTLYGVSCRELDILYELAKSEKLIIGARMMGGGFGGCTINLIERNSNDCLARIREAYHSATGIPLKTYRLKTASGARVLETREIRKISFAKETEFDPLETRGLE